MRSQDTYYRQAKKDGFRGRAAYKLQQMNNKYYLIHRGASVLDIGCWPGSWLQYIRTKIGRGYILGVDILPLKPMTGIHLIQSDIFDEDIIEKIKEKRSRFDLIVSDVAPNTTGNKDLDQARSAAMCEQVLMIADTVLKREGTCLIKIFQSGDAQRIIKEWKPKYESVKQLKPDASRKESKEMYLLFSYKFSSLGARPQDQHKSSLHEEHSDQQ